jgi:hypothetical protein
MKRPETRRNRGKVFVSMCGIIQGALFLMAEIVMNGGFE